MSGHTPGPTRGVDWWRFLPAYWFQNRPTDREWDALLNHLLDRYEIKCGDCVAEVGPITVWVENWPYAYGYAYPPQGFAWLPMVRTRKRLRRLLQTTTYDAARAAIARTQENGNG